MAGRRSTAPPGSSRWQPQRKRARPDHPVNGDEAQRQQRGAAFANRGEGELTPTAQNMPVKPRNTSANHTGSNRARLPARNSAIRRSFSSKECIQRMRRRNMLRTKTKTARLSASGAPRGQHDAADDRDGGRDHHSKPVAKTMARRRINSPLRGGQRPSKKPSMAAASVITPRTAA